MRTEYAIRSIYSIAKADFLERVRSHYFLITLGACVFAIYSFVPPVGAGYTIINLGNYRGFYNPAWIGAMVAMCVPFFTLFGFYLVNNAVQRDVETGVGQIIASTRVSKMQYLAGKLLSNMGVLMSILMVIALMTVLMFFVRGESDQFEAGPLLLPLLILTLPSVLITASIAVALDSFSGLGRGLINVAWFFIWIFFVSGGLGSPMTDVFGINTSIKQITGSLAAAHPDWNGNFGTGIILTGTKSHQPVFIWEGMQWTAGILFQRLFWMAASLLLIPLSCLWFDRFESVKEKGHKVRKSRFAGEKTDIPDAVVLPRAVQYRDLPRAVKAFSFPGLVRAELKLMLRGNSKFWMLLTAGAFLATALAPLEISARWILPLLWFFQVLILSGIGCRELKFRCSGYVFSAPSPLSRQLSASFTAAFLLMLVLSLPMISRMLWTGHWFSAYSILAAAAFIPVLAIASAVISGSGKLFEVLFTMMTYCALSAVPFLDFTAYAGNSQSTGTAHYLLLMTSVLLIIAFMTRKRQLQKG